MQKLTIKIPLYDCSCHIFIAENIKSFINKWVKKKKYPKEMLIGDDENIAGYAISPEDLKSYYLFYDHEYLTFNTIAHEISHLVDYILYERGIELTGETRAWTSGYLTEKIMNFILSKRLLVNEWLPKENQYQEKVKIPKRKKADQPVPNQLSDLQIKKESSENSVSSDTN